MTLSITFQQPNFGPDEAEAIALRRFGALGTARPLPSERDQNFLLRLADGSRVVLKIAHAGEDRDVLELQTLALRQLAELPLDTLLEQREDRILAYGKYKEISAG